MTPEQIAIARRLVAAPWWEWRVGIRLTGRYGNRCPMRLNESDVEYVEWWRQAFGADDPGPYLPDLTDDATGGVLLGRLPGGSEWQTWRSPDGLWSVGGFYSPLDQDTEAETLAHAAALALLEVRGG